MLLTNACDPREASRRQMRKPYFLGTANRLRGGRERRKTCRYRVFSGSASLGWWDGVEFRTVPALLKNVSLTGSLAVVEASPPSDATVWICLCGSHASDWVEAAVVSVTPSSAVQYRVGLRFPAGCPQDFFEAAIRCADLPAPVRVPSRAALKARPRR